jgi:hypothetical protein
MSLRQLRSGEVSLRTAMNRSRWLGQNLLDVQGREPQSAADNCSHCESYPFDWLWESQYPWSALNDLCGSERSGSISCSKCTIAVARFNGVSPAPTGDSDVVVFAVAQNQSIIRTIFPDSTRQ